MIKVNWLNDKDFFSLCVDTANGSIKDKDPEGAKFSDTAIRDKFFEALGVTGTDDKLFGIRFQIHQREVMALILETIQEILPNFYNSEFMRNFVEFKTYNFGEKPVFTIDDMNLFVISRIANGTWNTRRQKAYGKTDMVLDYETYDIHIYDDLFSFLAGRADFPTLIDKIMRSIGFNHEQRILNEFLELPNYAHADLIASGSPTTLEIVNLAETIRGLTGAEPIIVGTKIALYNILDEIKDYWLSNGMKDTINNTGGLPIWKGYQVLPIPTSIKPGTFELQPNINKLLVLPRFAVEGGSKFIKVANIHTPLIRHTTAPQNHQDMTLDYQLQYMMGVGIAVNHYFGVCDFA